MLTIENIRNPKRKSGFNYVGSAGHPGPNGGGGLHKWYAQDKIQRDGSRWRGPRRATPEEAAQDYCDYVNGSSVPLTIEDIRNPKRKSGFDHVSPAGGRGQGKVTGKPWGAKGHRLPGPPSTYDYRGPRRATPEEAAQDYCDYVNSQQVSAPPVLKTAGHEYVVDESDKDPEYQAALGVMRDRLAQRRGQKQGYVYLILEMNDGGGIHFGKVGYSTNPKKRVAELQTGNPRPLRLHALKKGTEADERALHAKYIKLNVLQEWFNFNMGGGKELLLEFDLNHDGIPWADAARQKKETKA